ncbi:MAG: DUF6677 family protein [Fimbriiglobus sp.]
MPPPPTPPPLPPLDPLAGLLSYLVPGLGQVVQGRVVKGVLFFVCLYGLFFYGLVLGQMKNVWLPDPTPLPPIELISRGGIRIGTGEGVGKSLAYRTHFLAQFWIGAAAWPAVGQYVLTPTPKFDGDPPPRTLLGNYMQAPTEEELNQLQRDGNKLWDLGWVYTVIAGVLTLLVIFDAVAGPVVRPEEPPTPTPATDPPAPGGPPA